MERKEPPGQILSGTTEYNPIKAPFTLFIRAKDALCTARLVQERIDRNAPEYLIREAFNQLSKYGREEGLEKRLEENGMSNDAELLENYIKEAEKCIIKQEEKYIIQEADFKLQIDSIVVKLSRLTGDLKDQVVET